jgi:predicted RNase H-like nuclease (RuvC/YqgF family)
MSDNVTELENIITKIKDNIKHYETKCIVLEKEVNEKYTTQILEQELIISQAKDTIRDLKKSLKAEVKSCSEDWKLLIKSLEEQLKNQELNLSNAILLEKGNFHQSTLDNNN